LSTTQSFNASTTHQRLGIIIVNPTIYNKNLGITKLRWVVIMRWILSSDFGHIAVLWSSHTRIHPFDNARTCIWLIIITHTRIHFHD
jgi:hypothetical protein